ncbi:MAG TPA: 1-acyl-sn-glycerol-3-phosphate acyltransferase [Thermoanaerobaculia bacterium]|nr:1-acyl-sn-glycerol-3-phosphate acyltransferase [Thermoanaerobaculia bacterium]
MRRLTLSEIIVAALLTVVCAAFAIGVPAALPLHLGIAILFLIAIAAARRFDAPIVSAIAVVVVLMTLYSTLAEPAFVLMGRAFDASLARFDAALFRGNAPAVIAQQFVTPRVLEFFSFIYGIFIPYLWLSIMLGTIGRERHERAAFVLGLSVVYSISYLGYLFVPARGPVEFYTFLAPLHGGRFHDLVLQSVAATGGNHGAFPSLHVGASAYLCLFDLRRNRVRGMTWAPIVLLIAISTIVLRYHYVADILTGFAIAFIADRIALRRFARPRLGAPRTLFAALARAGVGLFFDRIDVEGSVPADGPLLIVANHTNSLVDGLVVTVATARRVSLTAKAALKRNPLLAAITWLADVVPFYRRQDDLRDVAKNVDSFAAIRERLACGGAVCIFPEGISHSDASMRELKTGAARIALDFAAAHEGLRIVPVGLHYDAKQRFRSSVLVRFGEPIAIPADADARALTQLIDERIRALTANFGSVREALWLRWTAELVATRGEEPRAIDQEESDYRDRARLLGELRDDYEHADREQLAPLVNDLRAYRRELRRHAIAQREIFLSMHPAQAIFFVFREVELLVAGAVFFAVGVVQHGVAFVVDRALTLKLSVDLDHWASNAIFYGFAIFPVTWLIGIGLVAHFASWPWALAYALAIPFTLIYTVLYFERAGRAVRRARTFLRFVFDRRLHRDLQQRGRELLHRIEEARP